MKPVTKATVFTPTNQQFPFVDFLIVYPSGDVTGIQCTVNQRHHKPTPSTVKKVIEPLEKNNLKLTKIIWAIPKSGGINRKQPLSETKTDPAPKPLKDKYENLEQNLLIE